MRNASTNGEASINIDVVSPSLSAGNFNFLSGACYALSLNGARRGIKVENIVNRETRFSRTRASTLSRTFTCDVSDRRPSPTWVSIGKCQGIPWITPRSRKGERERRVGKRKMERKKRREHPIHTQEEISNLIGDISRAGKMSGEISLDRCALPSRGKDRGGWPGASIDRGSLRDKSGTAKRWVMKKTLVPYINGPRPAGACSPWSA